MDELKRLENIAKELQGTSGSMVDKWINDPEIIAAASKEQMAAINSARGAYDLKGTNPTDKLAELNKIMDNVVSLNK